MTQSVNSPPSRAKAATGNLVHELRRGAHDLAGDIARRRAMMMRDRYAVNPGVSLGMTRIIRGSVEPGAILGGAALGIPAQQVISQGLLQKMVKASPMVADGVTGVAGTVLHLIFRTSFTFGFGAALLFPFIGDLTEWGLAQLGVVGPSSPVNMTGTKPAPTIAGAGKINVNPQARASAQALRQRLLAKTA